MGAVCCDGFFWDARQHHHHNFTYLFKCTHVLIKLQIQIQIQIQITASSGFCIVQWSSGCLPISSPQLHIFFQIHTQTNTNTNANTNTYTNTNYSKLWVLYCAMVFGMLANTITTTSRSNLSKLMEEHEVK